MNETEIKYTNTRAAYSVRKWCLINKNTEREWKNCEIPL